MNSSVDLIVFTVAGRSHLLLETWKSFKKHCDFRFDRVILSIAGMDDKYFQVVKEVKPDVCLWDWHIPGYYKSSKRAVSESEADYYFWLEDDYRFERNIPISSMLSLLKSTKDLVQIAIPMGQDNKNNEITMSEVAWMLATVPHLGNGRLMREKYAEVDPGTLCELGETINIESFRARCFKGYKAGVLGTAQGRYMTHIGAMYSSKRELVSVKGEQQSIADSEIEKNRISVQSSKMFESGKSRHSLKQMVKKSKFALRHVFTFFFISSAAIITYPFSRRSREFVARATQYHKNTP